MKPKELGQSFEPIKIEVSAENKARVEHNFIKDLMELKEVTTTVPTFVPKKFYDQIQFYLMQRVVTVSIASPGVVTYTGHGFIGGEAFTLSTTGALPTGLTAGTTYYVKYVNADTFQITPVPFGTAINTSGTQSGTHTLSLDRLYIYTNNTWKKVTLT